MKLPKFSDVIKMSKDTIDATLAPIRVIRAKKQAELEMSKLDETIATQEAHIHEECCRKEVDFSKIIELQDALALACRKRKQYTRILEEMFAE